MLDLLRRNAWWLVPLLLFDIWLVHRLRTRNRQAPAPAVREKASEPGSEVAATPLPPEPPPRPVLLYTTPTAQTNLWDTESTEVYQPTASGRIQSAHFGSTRTRGSGGRFLPAFHMGIDIAPLQRDRQGNALDEVVAVTDGRVAYANRVAGNSTYGIYVVLLHDDPLGEIYTLYAHLASVEPGLRAGQTVERGDRIGIMGHTASTGIPRHRAHLHFEIGVINNSRFARWYRAQNLIPDHGTYHGHNLTGIQPLAIYGVQPWPGLQGFSMLDYLIENPPAFTLLFTPSKLLDYYRRYPDLWEGSPYAGGPIVMDVSEGGVPQRARAATPEEAALLTGGTPHVLAVDEEVLGRNGLRLVVRRSNQWVFGQRGRRWLEILTY